MKRIDTRLWPTLVGLLLTLTGNVCAQEARGTIQGRVLDSSGAIISGASVQATNLATKTVFRATTDAQGSYNLPYLAPGFYTLSATAKGFKRTDRSNIELTIDQRLQVDMVLELGSVQETVVVTAETPILDTASANLGQVVDSRRVAELPTPDGSPMSLVYLTPGVANTYPAAPSAVSAPELQQNAITQSAFGGLPRGSVDFTLDGVPNTQNSIADYGSGFVNSPPADIVSEFKIETPFDASVGHTSGLVVNFVLKTGGNSVHGSAWYVDREPEWGANNWFANRAGTPLGDFTYRRWGATLTGPVVIPKVYDGHDRTFFTYGYEDLSEIQAGGTYTTTVPTAAEVGGDFSNLLTLGSQYQIYDPATTTPAGNGRYSRTPFPGNVIPTSRISPIAQAIAGHYPQPNAPGEADGVNNFTNPNVGTPRGYYNHIGRVDHYISDKQRFYVRVAGNLRTDGPYRVYWNDPAIGENWRGP
ncbi:MAG TPA: carboxypeptidase-like regulatory domain-containing protein, partial [Tepidisphaeraceae bacterium]|nr:carboxypeptidase-like regulatory domain-containing protein [Tepidisphaeraceae bacterium]